MERKQAEAASRQSQRKISPYLTHSRAKQSFFQKFREIAPTVGHNMNINRMDRFMDTVEYAVWFGLDFPVRKNVDSSQFRGGCGPDREAGADCP